MYSYDCQTAQQSIRRSKGCFAAHVLYRGHQIDHTVLPGQIYRIIWQIEN